MTKCDLIVGSTEHDWNTETVKKGQKRDFAMVYVPKKTNTWANEENKIMLILTTECLQAIITQWQYGVNGWF